MRIGKHSSRDFSNDSDHFVNMPCSCVLHYKLGTISISGIDFLMTRMFPVRQDREDFAESHSVPGNVLSPIQD